MALPVGLTTVTVTGGPYTDSLGRADTGTVEFTASTPVVWAPTGAVVFDGPVTGTLNAGGSLSILLPANDVVGLSVTGWTYTVRFNLKSYSGDRRTILPIMISLPSSAPVVDLDLVEQLTTDDGVTVGLPAVVSVAGLSGAVQVADLRAVLGLGTAAYTAATAYAARASNLADLASASSARSNLGLGTAATHNHGDYDPSGSAATAQQTAIGAAAGLAIALG